MDQITEEDFGMPKNVFNDVFILSEKQEQLMEILWKSDKSLTSRDIMQILNDPHADYTLSLIHIEMCIRDRCRSVA